MKKPREKGTVRETEGFSGCFTHGFTAGKNHGKTKIERTEPENGVRPPKYPRTKVRRDDKFPVDKKGRVAVYADRTADDGREPRVEWRKAPRRAPIGHRLGFDRY